MKLENILKVKELREVFELKNAEQKKIISKQEMTKNCIKDSSHENNNQTLASTTKKKRRRRRYGRTSRQNIDYEQNSYQEIESNSFESQKQLVNKISFDSFNEVYNQLNELKLEENEDLEEKEEEFAEKPVFLENWKFQTVVDFKLSETIKRYQIVVIVRYDNSSNVLPKKSTDLSTIKYRFVKQSPQDIEIFHSILQLIDKNKNYFTGDFKSDDKWMRVSEEMFDLGYNGFTSVKCREFFQTLKSVYIQVLIKLLFFSMLYIFKNEIIFQLLQYTPNFRTASKIFPLFKTFHSMDLKHLSKEITFNKIMILRNRPEFDVNVVQY